MNNGHVPTARHWFGYVSARSFALVANQEKTVDAPKLAAALENFELPDDVKLQPNKCYYRKGDHQLMTSAFVGEAQSKGQDDPEDLFRVDEVIPGDKTAPPFSRPAALLSGQARELEASFRSGANALTGSAASLLFR